jgi:hypothetical protein
LESSDGAGPLAAGSKPRLRDETRRARPVAAIYREASEGSPRHARGAFSCKACTTAQTVPTLAPISCRIDHDWGIHVAVVCGHRRWRRGRVCVGRHYGQSDFRISRRPPRWPAIDRPAWTTLRPSWGPLVGNVRLAPPPGLFVPGQSLEGCKLPAHTHGSIATVVCARDGPHARPSVFLPDLPRPTTAGLFISRSVTGG